MKKAALILSAAICVVTISARAADWTDANNATYTALKSINGGGLGYIATDFKPAGTDTVKFKFKPSTVNGNDCIYCSRYINGSGYATQQFCCFRISSAFRVDSHDLTKSGKTTYKRQYTCDTTKPLAPGTEYTLSADYYNAVVTINGTMQTLTTSPASDKMAASSSSPFNPGSILVLLASHSSSSANAASAATLTGIDNKATCDLYYFQLWSYEGALSHNFMPAVRDSDSVVGLYDTVTQKFYPATDGSLTGAAYDASERAGKKWTGAGGDNKMSTAANWEGGVAPQAGDSLDFTIAAPFAAIVADIDATFGKIYLGAADLPAFSGALAATAINDFARMQAYDTATADFTFKLAAPVGQDFIWNGGAAANWSMTDSSWLYNNAASVWYDNNNAIFDTADATATLTVDATANSLEFNRNATVDGTATLTVPTVSVAADVSATISAPTDGALEKTGEGTLTLGSSRTEQTTLTEGTLAMASGATLDLAKLTLGTDPAKPVSLNLGGAGLSADLTACMSATVGGAAGGSVAIDNGAITNTANLRVANGSLTLGSGADVTMNASAERWVCVGGINSDNEGLNTIDASLVLDGAAITKKGTKSVFLSIGDFGSYPSKGTMIVKNGGSCTTENSAYVAQGCEGHLRIDGEKSSVTVWNIVFCNAERCAANENGYVVVTNGGTVVVNQLDYGSGKGEGYFRFDGGTLRARSSGVTLLPAHEKLNYIVGAEDGTIDNDGKNIIIAKGLSGTGTIKLTGSGKTTFAAGVGAEGGVWVDTGTTLTINGATPSCFGMLILENGSTLDIATPASDVAAFAATELLIPKNNGAVTLTSGGGAFGEGLYAICKMSGVTEAEEAEAAGAKFAPSTGGLAVRWILDGDMLMLKVGDESNVNNTWTGSVGDGDLSNPENWYGGKVPTSGTAIINCGAEATLTKGDTFAPTSITFGPGCGPVTIEGGDFTGIVAVTNLSSASHTINAKVYFAGDIQVKQAAMAETSDLTKAHVTFAGGAYAAEGCSLESGDSAAVYSRCIFGKYYLSSTSDNRWAAQYQSGGTRVCVADGSSLYIPYASNLTELYVGTGAKVDVGDILLNAEGRLSYLNYGEMAVTNLTMTGKGDRHLTYNQSTDYSSVFKFNSLTNSMTGNWFYLGNAAKVDSNSVFYFGEGGVNFSGNAATYCFGSNQKYAGLVIIRPWYGDFTIAKRDDDGVSVLFNNKVEFNTNDESGVPRKIIWEAKTRSNRGSLVTVTGNGTLLVNNTHFIDGTYYPSVTVKAPATLAFGKGANLGRAAVTVDKDATMEVLSGINKFDGGLTLNDGATLAFNFTKRTVTPQIVIAEGKTLTVEGAVKVMIPEDSKWPTAGEKILTTCGGFAGKTVELVDPPNWVRGLSVNAEGNIVLDVKPMGTRVIVR